MAYKGPRQGTAHFRRRYLQSWTCEKATRHQAPGHRKAEQAEVTAICDFKRLGCIHERQISGTTDLRMTSLEVAAHPFELQIYEAQIVSAAGDMGP